MNNQIFMIRPYKYHGAWVFDDERVGLVKEPFVAGMDDIIDKMTATIDNALFGFKLFFSHEKFPFYDIELNLIEKNNQFESYGGNWYYCVEYHMNGWLCPALFLYYPEAPKKLFAKVKKINE